MARISDYQLNSKYTGLRMLPTQYSRSFNFGGSTYSGFNGVLASSTITVPAGAYIDNILIKSSYLSLNYIGGFGDYYFDQTGSSLSPGLLSFYVERTSSTVYTATVRFAIGSSYSVTIPLSTMQVIIRLQPGPWN